MFAYQGNLCIPSEPSPPALAGPEFHDFDIAAVGLGFHHFDNPDLAATRLVQRLKPGGLLFIIDFLPHQVPQTGHAAAHTVTHHGFSEARVKALFETAGAAKDFGFETALVEFTPEAGAETTHRQVFFAKGIKA